MAQRSTLPTDGPIEVDGYPDRVESMSILKQGPVRRLTVWREIIDDPNVGDDVKGYLFENEGLLLIDLHDSGENHG